MPTENTTPFLKQKSAEATKIGRNGGSVSYLVLADPSRQHLLLSIIGNSGGGFWSREEIPLEAVERCLPEDRSQPVSAKAFARSFKGRSANNPTFMTAILKAEGLLAPVDGKSNLYQASGDWSTWKATMLASDGVPYAPPAKAGMSPERVADSAVGTDATPAAGSSDMTRQDTPGDVEPEDAGLLHRGRKDRAGKRGKENVDARAL